MGACLLKAGKGSFGCHTDLGGQCSSDSSCLVNSNRETEAGHVAEGSCLLILHYKCQVGTKASPIRVWQRSQGLQ